MEPLKEMFNRPFYERLAIVLNNASKGFETQKFIRDAISNIEDLSLNQRMRHTSLVMKKYMPNDYAICIEIMKRAVQELPKGYTTLIFPDFVGLYGHENHKISMEALAFFTRFGSSEFAIREFLKRDFGKTIKVMEKWAENHDSHIRRLASEGSRPRLPWSFKLDEVIKNPSRTRNILERLKTDDTLYVRKSVANHLNDFSKDHPDYMLEIIQGWNLANTHTLWIAKHACRNLIKKGHRDALNLFMFEKNVKIKVENLKLDELNLQLGEILQFEFDIQSTTKNEQKLAVDYCIHYYKKTGLSPKVFKLKELALAPQALVHLTKKQLFQDFTTRKHYSGPHVLEIIINGKVYAKQGFNLSV